MALSAIAVMLGHCYPVFLRFKGGKAVACFIGAFLYIAPLALACCALVFVAVVTRERIYFHGVDRRRAVCFRSRRGW